MHIFKYLDYKAYLNWVIRQNRSVYGYKTKLAKAANCRASYFSQVLNGEFHLSDEHALGLAEFWRFSPRERDYLVQMIHYARAATPDLKRYYASMLKDMAFAAEGQVLKGNSSEVSTEWKSIFYSSWHYTAIHELTTFPGGRTADAIAKSLELAGSLVDQTLEELEKMGLVERRGSSWHAKVVELLVPVGTQFSAQHIAHWTNRASLDALKKKNTAESFHKCWVFGISPTDFFKLRTLMLEQIQKCQKIIPASEREQLACMNLHLFMV